AGVRTCALPICRLVEGSLTVGRFPVRLRRPGRAAATVTAAVAVLTATATAAFAFGDLDGGEQALGAAVLPEAPPPPQASAAPLVGDDRDRAVESLREAVAGGGRTTRADAAPAAQPPAPGAGGASGEGGQREASMCG